MSFLSKLFGRKVEHQNIKVLSIQEFKTAIAQKGVTVIDVRTASEFKSGAIVHAKNIDFFNRGAMEIAFSKLDPKKPIYVYCRSGNRSNQAAKLLAKIGFEEIYDLKGGYMAWS